MRRGHLIGGLGPAKALAGATAIDPGGSAISDSLILIAGGRIQSRAPRDDAPSGGASEVWNKSEKFVLASATLHAARVTRFQESVGSLRPGHVANRGVLRRGPRLSAENRGAVESIMAEGEWVKSPRTERYNNR